MSCNVPLRCSSILVNANTLAPLRRRSSDGVCGDAAHQAEVSDHNPSGPNNYAHAVDISQSTEGSPYWGDGRNPTTQQPYDVFDAHGWGWKIAGAYIAATPAERADRFGWLKYMVSFNGQVDVIFNPSVSSSWRINGSPKTEHANHLHISINEGLPSENDIRPIFVEEEMPLNAADLAAITAIVNAEVSKGVAHALGGYIDGRYVDGALVTAARKQLGLSKP